MLYISSFHYSYWHTVSQVSVMGKQGLMMCKYVLGGLACFVVEEKRKGQQKASHTSTGVLWCQLSLCGNPLWVVFIHKFIFNTRFSLFRLQQGCWSLSHVSFRKGTLQMASPSLACVASNFKIHCQHDKILGWFKTKSTTVYCYLSLHFPLVNAFCMHFK